MKRIIILATAIAFIFMSCKQQSKKNKEPKKISKRDYSISKDNGYNDIFLDSTEVENYILKDSIPDTTANRIRSFYNTRNYEFAWFSSDGIGEQAMGFSSLLNFNGDTSTKQKRLLKTMDNLMGDENFKVAATDKSIIRTELLLTESLINYSRANYEKGYVKRKELERFIPFKKTDAIELADSLFNKKHKDDKYFSDVNEPYKLLLAQLKNYVAIAKSGGWPSPGEDPKVFKENQPHQQVIALKKILSLTGDLTQNDSTDLFDENLKNGIKSFQTRFGFTPDGKITKPLLEQLNVPVLQRIKELLINMDRMRWLPQEPEGRLIIVNIPEFILHVYEGKKKVFSMPVVVGKEGHNTVLFSDMLTTIVFSPYWNVPPSIVKNEIVPGMAKDENYLAAHDMETNGNENGLPVVRQLPGPKNSLGKVKFLFPNSFNIYFHDTPSKSLFGKDVRAYSHGCIRLSEPAKMANYLLSDNAQWTPQKIDEAMNSGKEQFVQLKQPVPVFITYYTSWVDENGKLNFRNDIYGHDKVIAEKMFSHSDTAKK